MTNATIFLSNYSAHLLAPPCSHRKIPACRFGSFCRLHSSVLFLCFSNFFILLSNRLLADNIFPQNRQIQLYKQCQTNRSWRLYTRYNGSQYLASNIPNIYGLSNTHTHTHTRHNTTLHLFIMMSTWMRAARKHYSHVHMQIHMRTRIYVDIYCNRV